MMQISELKKDSGTAGAEMYFERHRRMVLINKLALSSIEESMRPSAQGCLEIFCHFFEGVSRQTSIRSSECFFKGER